mgnify:CR=1 FL=1
MTDELIKVDDKSFKRVKTLETVQTLKQLRIEKEGKLNQIQHLKDARVRVAKEIDEVQAELDQINADILQLKNLGVTNDES